MTRPVVYISGPLTRGDRLENVYQADKVHRWLMLAGYAPINPILTTHLPFAWQEDYPHSLWIECDLPIVEKCDALLRLPGASKGADEEVAHANAHGIPVFLSRETLDEWREAEWQ